jgi:hypothetical protein
MEVPRRSLTRAGDASVRYKRQQVSRPNTNQGSSSRGERLGCRRRFELTIEHQSAITLQSCLMAATCRSGSACSHAQASLRRDKTMSVGALRVKGSRSIAGDASKEHQRSTQYVCNVFHCCLRDEHKRFLER